MRHSPYIQQYTKLGFQIPAKTLKEPGMRRQFLSIQMFKYKEYFQTMFTLWIRSPINLIHQRSSFGNWIWEIISSCWVHLPFLPLHSFNLIINNILPCLNLWSIFNRLIWRQKLYYRRMAFHHTILYDKHSYLFLFPPLPINISVLFSSRKMGNIFMNPY